MMRRLPLIATALVLAAVATMVALGIWQLDRKAEKEALLADYAEARTLSAEAQWPSDPVQAQRAYYRRATVRCDKVGSILPMAGTSAEGEAGIAHVASCTLADGTSARVVLGWSRDPAPRQWQGGEASGIIAPGGDAGPRLVAAPPLAGLAASAAPDPGEIPNNHLFYAVQWFLFAGVALAIYALALRKRLAAAGTGR
jgi:surfeit locus 1 family protein